MVKWYSLFSHTGQETTDLAKMLYPDVELVVAITNNSRYEGPLPCIKLTLAKYINEWLMEPGNVEPGSIVTLNGYMRIIPEEVINYLHSINCRLLNIHPAPIQLYPDLRGKDPQERLYEGIQSGKYHYIGVVIHNVDAGVDTGSIVNWSTEFADPNMTKDELYQRLHDIGTKLWLEVFKEVANG